MQQRAVQDQCPGTRAGQDPAKGSNTGMKEEALYHGPQMKLDDSREYYTKVTFWVYCLNFKIYSLPTCQLYFIQLRMSSRSTKIGCARAW